MHLDLHIHTTSSDGAWSAADVVSGAAQGGLDVIAIADHDTTAAVSTAQQAGRAQNVQVIPALEVSSTHERRDVHVLGYFVDTESPALVRHRAQAFRMREDRMKEMIDRLSAEGVDVTFEEVEQEAGPDRVNIGRPHLAKALVTRGHATSVPGAFDALIGDHRPAFVPTDLLSPREAVELIIAGEGIPVWAHPPADLLDALLPRMMAAGLGGLEVYRPTHRSADVLRLEKLTRANGLFRSGGSDWHTPDAGKALGDFFVTADEVEDLLAAGGM